ncbi:hypothetical protein FQA39_LY14375 [Lamprigera yunnana]|nr:hypothetical protein FQA39_LY14375 [Lamprigera yunnana]
MNARSKLLVQQALLTSKPEDRNKNLNLGESFKPEPEIIRFVAILEKMRPIKVNCSPINFPIVTLRFESIVEELEVTNNGGLVSNLL